MTPLFHRSGRVRRAPLSLLPGLAPLLLAVAVRAGAQAAKERPAPATSLADTVIIWTNIDSANATARSLVDDFARRVPRVVYTAKSSTRGATYTLIGDPRSPNQSWHIGRYPSAAPGDSSQQSTQGIVRKITPVAFLGDYVDDEGVPQWIGLFGPPDISPELVATVAAIAQKSFVGSSANAVALSGWLHGHAADAETLKGVVASWRGFAETPTDKAIAACKADFTAAARPPVTTDSLAARVGTIMRIAGPGGARMLAVAADALSKTADPLGRLDRCAIRARLAALRP